MNITRNDAETALNDAVKAEEHSLTLYHYQLASPHLILWGLLWMIAGSISVISPENTGTGWLIVDTVGILGSGYLIAGEVRQSDKYSVQGEMLRYMATAVVFALFFTMTFSIFNPVSGIQVQSFITVLIAAIYMILGIWTGFRLAVIGTVVACLAAGVLIYTPLQFPFLVSALGGGALILGGLWMREA